MAKAPTTRPVKRREVSPRREQSLQPSRSDSKRSTKAERCWEAIRVIEEHDSGWGPTSIPPVELALVVAKHPIEVPEYFIKVPDLDGVTRAYGELPSEDNREEPVSRLNGPRPRENIRPDHPNQDIHKRSSRMGW